MNPGDLALVGFTLRMAALATAAILVPGIAAGLLLARYRGPGRGALDTLLSLPLVLPPTAVGLALLLLLARNGPLGAWLFAHGLSVVFTWKGVVLATGVMSFPLLVRSARTAFEEVDPRLVALARTLGCRPAGAFFRVALPLARRGIVAGLVLAFSRSLGEFGATILVAGNIPGRTQTLSLAIFQEVQAGRDRHALVLAGWTVALAFIALWSTEWLSHRRDPEVW
ncbi:MAG TPA: molybdate ABC transporter permease subunit [Vicinamibacteria bacterium]|nr:molybdate ABC transporter permease subunit [Vicinamibacteria bacterium]